MASGSSLPFSYENNFRPVFEFYPTLMWSAASLITMYSALNYYGVNTITLGIEFYSLYKTMNWGRKANDLFKLHSKLYNNYYTFVSTKKFDEMYEELQGRIKKEKEENQKNGKIQSKTKEEANVYWGTGFEWGAEHTQRLYQLSAMKRGFPELKFPNILKKLYGYDEKVVKKLRGSPYIHGIEMDNESEIMTSVDVFGGHVLVLGTTGSGKTRFLELMIAQAIARREPVIIIDPKGDKDLIARCIKELNKQGRVKDFKYFHPAHAGKSVRIDTISNFHRYTEIASRLTSQMAGDGAARGFKDAAWMFINNVVLSMLFIGLKPSIYLIRYYLTNIAELTEKVIVKFLNEKLGSKSNPESWRDKVQSNDKDKKIKNPLLAGMVDLAQQSFDASTIDPAVSAIIKMFTHDATHYSKMTTTLLPLLDQLTAGDLKELLSPDYMDLNDPREIVNVKSVVNQNQVLFMALDSLSDPMVGSTIGSMVLSDAAAVAGERYNYEQENIPDFINLYVDEASEVVNDKLIQILNKGRGAGFRATVCAQNVPDFYSKLGSEDTGRMVLGNANTLVVLRVSEGKTQEFCSEAFKMVRIKSTMFALDNKSGSDSNPTEWAAGYSERLQDAQIEMIDKSLLGMIPNLQYICRMADGRVMKGRIPLLTD
jgi:conjugal transfer pilus assembly protein TraD